MGRARSHGLRTVATCLAALGVAVARAETTTAPTVPTASASAAVLVPGAAFLNARLLVNDLPTGCEGVETLVAATNRLVGRDAFQTTGVAPLLARVTVLNDGLVYRATIDLATQAGERLGTRTTPDSANCAELYEGVALVLSLLIDDPTTQLAAREASTTRPPKPKRKPTGERSPAKRQPRAARARRRDAPTPSLTVAPLLAFGSGPGAFGAWAFVGRGGARFERGALLADVTFAGQAPSSVPVGTARVEAAVLALDARAGANLRWGAWLASAMAGGRAGSTRVAGRGFDVDGVSWLASFDALLAAACGVEGRFGSVQAELAAVVPLRPVRAVVGGPGATNAGVAPVPLAAALSLVLVPRWP